MFAKLRMEEVKQIGKKYWPTLLAFVIMAFYLMPLQSMIDWSGDAASIWTTIKTFGTEDMVPTYVLYKGFASVYPYVWFYKWAMALGLNEFFFVKLYHCVLFAYVAGIGFPSCIKGLTGKENKSWRVGLLTIALFWTWKYTRAFSQLMVDLPSMAFFLLFVNAALKIDKRKNTVWNYCCLGLLFGLNLCASGQYSLPAMAVAVFIVIKVLTAKIEKSKKFYLKACCSLLLVFLAAFVVKGYNVYFEKTVVDPLREEGAWIPTGDAWISIGLTRQIGVQRSLGGVKIPDYRGIAIMKDVYGEENFDEIYQKMIEGSVPYTIPEYFKLVFRYPGDFALRYFNRFFLILSPDGGNFSFLRLLIVYTLLYIAVIATMQRCEKVRDLFNAKTWIVLAFVFATAACIVTNIEMRTVMQIQGLIYAMAILSDTFWEALKKFCIGIKTQKLAYLTNGKVSYIFLIYLFYLIFCFMHMGSLYDGVPEYSSVLLRW